MKFKIDADGLLTVTLKNKETGETCDEKVNQNELNLPLDILNNLCNIAEARR